jgi:hypothetical protein
LESLGSNPTLSAILLKINRLADILNPLSGLSFVFGMSHMQFCKAQLRAVKVKPTGKSIHTSRLIITDLPISAKTVSG